jgi:hypothetical protein
VQRVVQRGEELASRPSRGNTETEREVQDEKQVKDI